jgi:hypothetical protein
MLRYLLGISERLAERLALLSIPWYNPPESAGRGGVNDEKGNNVIGRIRGRSASTGGPHAARAALLQSVTIGLVLLFSLLAGYRAVAAQEGRQTRVSREPIFDLSKDETAQEEPGTDRRFLIDIDLPSATPDERPTKIEQPDEPVSRTPASDSELWQVVRQLQQDFEMLKEEIAQLRSELRSIVPEDPDKSADMKRTITPFWISDAQLEEKEAGGG